MAARVVEAGERAGPVTPPLKHGLKDVAPGRKTGGVGHVAFSRDGTRVVTASADETARVWNAATGQPVTPSLAHSGTVTHASFSPDGKRLVTASADETARVWDAATGARSCRPSGTPAP